MIPFEGMEAKLRTTEIFKHIQSKADKASEELARIYGEPEVLKVMVVVIRQLVQLHQLRLLLQF